MGKIADRKFFSLLLLLLILTVKGLSYHTMAHNDEEEELVCEICEHVILSNITPIHFTTSFHSLEVFTATDNKKVALVEHYNPKTSVLAFYGRPPPSLF